MLQNLQLSGGLGLLVVVLFGPAVSLAQSSNQRLHVEWKLPPHHRSLSLSHLQTLLRKNDLRFRKCYQRTAKHHPKIDSQLLFRWTFNPKGKMVRCQPVQSRKKVKRLASCVCVVVSSFHLPHFKSEKNVRLRAQFLFSQQSIQKPHRAKKWGTLTKKQVVSVLRKHLRELQRCYHRTVFPGTPLVWKVALRWIVNSDGSVSQVKLQRSNVHIPQFHRCLVRSVSGWTFPRPRGGKKAKVHFPFVFKR